MGRRKYVGQSQRFGKGLLTFALIAILAVGAGYTATKYIIANYFGADNEIAGEENQQDQNFPGSTIITDQQEFKDGETENVITSAPETNISDANQIKQTLNLYCIQFGSFIAKEGADATVANLKAVNIDSMVFINDGSYKVIGTPYTQEEKAREAMASLKSVAGEEIFITTMEAWMK